MHGKSFSNSAVMIARVDDKFNSGFETEQDKRTLANCGEITDHSKIDRLKATLIHCDLRSAICDLMMGHLVASHACQHQQPEIHDLGTGHAQGPQGEFALALMQMNCPELQGPEVLDIGLAALDAVVLCA